MTTQRQVPNQESGGEAMQIDSHALIYAVSALQYVERWWNGELPNDPYTRKHLYAKCLIALEGLESAIAYNKLRKRKWVQP